MIETGLEKKTRERKLDSRWDPAQNIPPNPSRE